MQLILMMTFRKAWGSYSDFDEGCAFWSRKQHLKFTLTSREGALYGYVAF